jgi:hypothetical protein
MRVGDTTIGASTSRSMLARITTADVSVPRFAGFSLITLI